MQCAVRATALHACKHLVQPGWLDGRIPLVHTWVMCRAKLEDALERLQRIMSAMAADAAQAPPNTVERAARGLATPAAGGVPAVAAAAEGEEGTPSPRLADALSSGKIATRRRMASSLRPVPYPRH